MSETIQEEKKKCTKCKHTLVLSEYKQNRSGIYTKSCKRCLDIAKKNRDKNKCEHGRQKSRCKECDGVGMCEHGRQKNICKDCGGNQICEHGRSRSVCKDCGGGGICEHGRRRVYCKDCGGSQICEHNKRRDECSVCGGSQTCEHGRIRATCKVCGGSQICEHGRMKSVCRDCGGLSICKHNLVISSCRKCSKDPLKLLARSIVSHARAADKRMNNYDEANHIDIDFVREILTEQIHCHYCDIELQYVNFESDLATIERLDNKLGHIKSNCVIACRTCNYSRVGSRLKKLI